MVLFAYSLHTIREERSYNIIRMSDSIMSCLIRNKENTKAVASLREAHYEDTTFTHSRHVYTQYVY